MRHLPVPVSAEADEAEIQKLAEEPVWEPYLLAWIEAYRAYSENSGNPFLVAPHDFGEGVGDRQYSLYDSRKGSGPLRRIRRTKGLNSCPVCGSPVTGDLDHYLPRRKYPEFSIMRANLVPACTHCNSGGKRMTVHGEEPQRFIHPYFDKWADQEIWYVEIVPPFRAARFVPCANPDLDPTHKPIASFHLRNVLGDQFQLFMDNSWASIPKIIRMRVADLSFDSVSRQIETELNVSIYSDGRNSWSAALWRGIHRDSNAIEYLRKEATTAELPPGVALPVVVTD